MKVTEQQCISVSFTLSVVIGGYKPTPYSHLAFLMPVLPTRTNLIDYVRPPYEPTTFAPLPCNITYKIAQIPRNHGRDASAFYHFVHTYYNSLPDHVAFLHGHLGNAWHTTSFAITSRLRHYLLNPPDGLITFTAGPRSEERPLEWFGHRLEEAEEDCWSPILRRHNVVYNKSVSRSCCATFVVSSRILHRHPKSLYQSLFRCMMRYKSDQRSARDGFEFVIPDMLASTINANISALSEWYDAAKKGGQGLR